jgi:NhaA family Na+:H+ antiporter
MSGGTVSTPRHLRAGRIGRYFPPLGSEFVSIETNSGLALVGAAVAALVWVNLAAASYADTWALDLGPLTLRGWINDGLMTLFFFVVGLEIKREVVEGELRDPRHAALPAFAALGGMIVPALVYAAWTAGGAGAHGWGVPMATDIAFALGVLALLGSRVRPEAKLFLLSLAIVDDIGAIIVIAVFYSSDVSATWLLAALVVCVATIALRRLGMAHPFWFVVPGIALWVCVHESGVHATIAGILLAFLLPTAPGAASGPLERLEHALHPFTSFVVVPLFALANAGVLVGGDRVQRAFESPVTLGVVTGLVVGKTIGITAFAWVAVRLRLARLADGLDHLQILAVAMVAGIGFTVSLFVAELAFTGPTLAEAKIGILGASLIAAAAGLGAVSLASRRHAREGVPGPHVVALVDDLMDRARLTSTVPGVEIVRTVAEVASADVVVLDLARHGGALAEVRALAPRAWVVGFGPHVDTHALSAATAAGADRVLPRSRFFQDPPAALRPPDR